MKGNDTADKETSSIYLQIWSENTAKLRNVSFIEVMTMTYVTVVFL